MTDVQAAASFNPDDASGLLDDAQMIITAVKVDAFTAKQGRNAGTTYINLDVTFKGANGEIVEHYLIGGADQWAPNATKTGVISVGKEGGKLWNKSDAIKFVTSLINAGFPKERISNDMSVIVGTDVHVKRITDGTTYTDKTGKDRARSSLLVTKVYALPGATKAATAPKKSVARTATATADGAGNMPAVDGGTVDELATQTLITLLEKGAIGIKAVAQPVFMALTKAKKTAERAAVVARVQEPEFLAGLAEAGYLGFDGETISAAA